jgi:hypothetical protein
MIASLLFFTVHRVTYAEPAALCQTTLNGTEYDVLHDLFQSTNGPSWKWTTGVGVGRVWNFSTACSDPCVDRWQVGVNKLIYESVRCLCK